MLLVFVLGAGLGAAVAFVVFLVDTGIFTALFVTAAIFLACVTVAALLA